MKYIILVLYSPAFFFHFYRDPYEFSESDSDSHEEEEDKKAKKKKKKKVAYPLWSLNCSDALPPQCSQSLPRD